MSSIQAYKAHKQEGTGKQGAQNGVLDDSQQQPAPDTSNEGLVYSAVVQW